ncbi:hypothetical protein Tco_0319860 [Tanacetum coccineum]
MKWLPKLMGYDYEVVYKKGSENGAADALSRLGSGTKLLSIFVSSITTDLMKRVQNTRVSDDAICAIITSLRNGQNSKKHYAWINEKLLRKSKIVVGQDESLRRELLQYFHEDSIGGHSGIIMVNVIPPDHDHDVPVVEPNQHDDAPVVPEPVLEDEDEDPEEDEFEEEEDPQEEDDMEIDIEEDENEPELTYPYEEVDPLNPPPPASESEPDDEIEVENPIEHEDETVPVSVYEVGESSTAAIPREDGDRLLPGFMRRDIDSLFGRMLILDLGNEVRSSVEQGTAAMEKLVEKLGNVEEKAECKKLKKELEEARLSNTFLRMQNERVERDLYWTRVRAHEFYQEMIHRGFVFEERPNEAIDVPIEDEKSPLSEPRGSPPDV